MLSENERKALLEAESQGSDILGDWLRHNGKNGLYSLGDERFDTDGVLLAVVMPLTNWGEVLWSDQKIIDRHVGRFGDGFCATRVITPGWSPYTALVCVRVDEERRGQLITCSGTDWGIRKAFLSLVTPYKKKGGAFFPIISLGNRARGDVHDTQDPVFKIETTSHFAELLDEDVPQLEAPATAPRLAAPVANDDTSKTCFGRTSRYAAEYNPPATEDIPAATEPFAGIDPDDLIYD
jgi:hypothetical protein